MMSWAHDLELLILETFKCLFVMILLEVKSNTQEIAHNSDGGLRFGVFSGAARSSLCDLSGRLLSCTPVFMCLVSNCVPAHTPQCVAGSGNGQCLELHVCN